ncbi:PREDICTED: zinc finger ZZ-type and EF-hand domain-containing protein 1-like [Thamnophis sirtalis]|uniref:Zinc finger ZZ-type and EF-hand domain-containing protein 1-like n=1 Tax=Thamnophis sirtalis TaxID=35019 RepID=A0A6I9YTE3_9SAUR|nr:PREDICTED: zinc finger ZZ-type and EF-hand domain-containing protein 1-like [Thamnophis sirtalis]
MTDSAREGKDMFVCLYDWKVQKKESGQRYKSYLDFTGLDLKLFWNFYSKLHQNPREECIDAQAVLLQLLQSCFSMLTSDPKAAKTEKAAQKTTLESTEAAEELYKHLCEVVNSDSESTPLKTLKQEVTNTLLNGAAIFFPHRHTRREQLFAMLNNITEQKHKPSAQLTFKSLCAYFRSSE